MVGLLLHKVGIASLKAIQTEAQITNQATWICDFTEVPFLGHFVLPRKTSKFTKNFLSLPSAQKPWKNEKTPILARKFLANNQPRKSDTDQAKEGQGLSFGKHRNRGEGCFAGARANTESSLLIRSTCWHNTPTKIRHRSR